MNMTTEAVLANQPIFTIRQVGIAFGRTTVKSEAFSLFDSSSTSPFADSYRGYPNATNSTKRRLYEEEYLEIPTVKVCFMICYVLLISVAALGNLFLIVYVVRSANFSGSSSASPMLILNLAVCDFFRSALLTPFKFLEFLNFKEGYIMGDNYCRTATYFICLLGFAEFHSVAAISQERLLLICFPLKAKQWLTPRNVWSALAAIWFVAAMFSLAYVLLLSKTYEVTLTSGTTYKLCTVYFFEEEPNYISRGCSTFMFLFYYTVPVIIVAVSYFIIFQILTPRSLLAAPIVERGESFSAERTLSSSTSLSLRAESSKMKRQKNGDYLVNREAACKIMRERRYLAKMMMAITLCFAIFNSPVFLAYLSIGWGRKLHKNSIFWLLIIKFLPTVSSLFNPFVYCTRGRTLRRNFRNFSGKGRTSSQSNELTRH